MTDESSRIKQQSNIAAVGLLGLFAVLSGTAELVSDREHSLRVSCLSLLILVGLVLLTGSLVRYIKVWKAFPHQSASSDIKKGLRILLILFPGVLLLCFLLGTELSSQVFYLGASLSFALFFLGRGLYTRSQESSSDDTPEPTAEPETPDPTPPEDE